MVFSMMFWGVPHDRVFRSAGNYVNLLTYHELVLQQLRLLSSAPVEVGMKSAVPVGCAEGRRARIKKAPQSHLIHRSHRSMRIAAHVELFGAAESWQKIAMNQDGRRLRYNDTLTPPSLETPQSTEYAWISRGLQCSTTPGGPFNLLCTRSDSRRD